MIMQYSILIGLLILGELALVGYIVAVQDQVSCNHPLSTLHSLY